MHRLFEPLEGRRMLSTTLPTLDVTLAPASDGKIELTINNAVDVKVHEFVNTGGQVVVTSGTQTPVFTGDDVNNHGTFLGVERIVINGTTGDDVVTLDDADIKAFINTGNGKDTIFVNNVAETTVTDPDLVTINAGNGKDSIVATTDGSQGTITTVVLSKGTDSVEAPFA